jgi:hypothetical protein
MDNCRNTESENHTVRYGFTDLPCCPCINLAERRCTMLKHRYIKSWKCYTQVDNTNPKFLTVKSTLTEIWICGLYITIRSVCSDLFQKYLWRKTGSQVLFSKCIELRSLLQTFKEKTGQNASPCFSLASIVLLQRVSICYNAHTIPVIAELNENVVRCLIKVSICKC